MTTHTMSSTPFNASDWVNAVTMPFRYVGHIGTAYRQSVRRLERDDHQAPTVFTARDDVNHAVLQKKIVSAHQIDFCREPMHWLKCFHYDWQHGNMGRVFMKIAVGILFLVASMLPFWLLPTGIGNVLTAVLIVCKTFLLLPVFLFFGQRMLEHRRQRKILGDAYHERLQKKYEELTRLNDEMKASQGQFVKYFDLDHEILSVLHGYKILAPEESIESVGWEAFVLRCTANPYFMAKLKQAQGPLAPLAKVVQTQRFLARLLPRYEKLSAALEKQKPDHLPMLLAFEAVALESLELRKISPQ